MSLITSPFSVSKGGNLLVRARIFLLVSGRTMGDQVGDQVVLIWRFTVGEFANQFMKLRALPTEFQNNTPGTHLLMKSQEDLSCDSPN